MGKRAASLAQIQEYLDDPNGSTPAPSESVLPEEAAPHAAPGVKPEQADAGEGAAQEEEQQVEITEKQRSAVEERTDAAALRLRQVVNYGKFRLEGLSMPGGLFLPITLLFVFFLALLPIGGHTRLGWLWEVMTGNAALNQAEDLNAPPVPMPGPGGLTSPGGPSQTITPQPSPPDGGPVLVPYTLTLFTGVEQME